MPRTARVSVRPDLRPPLGLRIADEVLVKAARRPLVLVRRPEREQPFGVGVLGESQPFRGEPAAIQRRIEDQRVGGRTGRPISVVACASSGKNVVHDSTRRPARRVTDAVHPSVNGREVSDATDAGLATHWDLGVLLPGNIL